MKPTSVHRAIYTEGQISKYFTHISLPLYIKGLLNIPTKLRQSSDSLKILTSLQQHQICTVPFENLALHYSPHHNISLDPHHLYVKIVENKRGGYCMENNCFFGTILQSLGFTVHGAGARVSHAANGMGGENYAGWSHMVNIVTLADGKKYMLDVGFGSNGPIQPLPLDPQIYPLKGIKPAEMRLELQNIPENSDPEQKLWVYQHRYDPHSEWAPMYCFTELEFLPQDYEIMNFWTSKSRKSWFTTTIVAVIMMMEDEEILGMMILLGKDLKRRLKGKMDHMETCEKEMDRVTVLKQWFGVELREDEKAGIRGLITELKG